MPVGYVTVKMNHVLGKISITELLFVGAVVLIVLSASRMSALGNALGKFVYSFKKASKGDGFVEGKVTKVSSRTIEDAQIVDEKKPHS